MCISKHSTNSNKAAYNYRNVLALRQMEKVTKEAINNFVST